MSAVPENRNTGTIARRIRVLQYAADYLGQEALARALAIGVRSLRQKLSADRGVTDDDLRHAAIALETRGRDLIAHATLLRGVVA